MKKVSLVLTLLFAAGLSAADFWQSKPFTEWSPKDVTRMLTDSPWAHRVIVSLGSAPPAMEQRRNGGVPSNPGDAVAQPGPQIGGIGGPTPGDATAGGFGGASRDRDDPLNGAVGQSVTVIVRWQTAMPMKQATIRSKYGSEAGTSAEAKKFLEHPEPEYVISVSGLPATFAHGDLEKLKKDVKAQTSLNAKGRAPVGAMDVQFSPSGQSVDAFFMFPRGVALTLDDKDVEFSTRIGGMTVRYKFHLKDMVYDGKLDL